MSRARGAGRALKMVTVTIFLAGCMNPPRYNPPQAEMPAQWKVEAPFRLATPQEEKLATQRPK